jgi:hypothetical protein
MSLRSRELKNERVDEGGDKLASGQVLTAKVWLPTAKV